VTSTPAKRRSLRWILPVAAALAAVAAGVLGSLPSSSGASLRLTDGRVLEGRDVRLDGDLYLLELEGGSVVPVPVALVAAVGVGGGPKPQPPPPGAAPGLTQGEPQQLAGTPVRPSMPQEQLAVFGEPAKFQQDVVHSSFQPSYWVPDRAQNNFNPSKWAKSPTDPNWQPTSAFDPKKDVLAESRSTWQKAPTDSAWAPQDGFKKKPW
jgi:hypothetical protein